MSEHPTNLGWLTVLLFFLATPILLGIFGFSVWFAVMVGNDTFGFRAFFTVVALVSGAVLTIGVMYSRKASATLPVVPVNQTAVVTTEASEPTSLP